MTIKEFDTINGIYQFNESDLVTGFHAHPALEIIIANQGDFNLTTSGTSVERVKFAVIPPNQMHAFSGSSSNCDFIFIEPGFDVLNRILEITDNRAPNEGIIAIENREHQNAVLALLQNHRYSANRQDSRILQCIHFIQSHLTDSDLSLAHLAAEVHLSPSRLSHLFKAQSGVTIQKYIIWTRMKFAIHNFIHNGLNLTQAAHSAGFHDSAHFSKHFKDIFGVKPSLPYNNSSIVQAQE